MKNSATNRTTFVNRLGIVSVYLIALTVIFLQIRSLL